MILSPSQNNLHKIIQIIQDGDIVCLPTETVYGLAGDATSDVAAHKIYDAKSRPKHNPLIAHYHSLDHVMLDGLLTQNALKLAQKFWPGPLTLILRKTKTCRISQIATCGLDTIAVRVPMHPHMQYITSHGPIIAPSANISGKLSSVTAEQASAAFPHITTLNGGQCNAGIESTIVDLSETQPQILRHGAIPQQEIATILNMPVTTINHAVMPQNQLALKAPGLLSQHYSPSCAVKINVVTHSTTKNEGLLTFGDTNLQGYKVTFNLSPNRNIDEAAKNLFHMMYEMSQMNLSAICITPIPHDGVGEAINDRITRASANKSC